MCDKNAADCRCHKAVMNGYRGMKLSGAAESEALDAAFRIHKFHHPEMAEDVSRLTVERWLYTAHTH
jgi:hypothetical protein